MRCREPHDPFTKLGQYLFALHSLAARFSRMITLSTKAAADRRAEVRDMLGCTKWNDMPLAAPYSFLAVHSMGVMPPSAISLVNLISLPAIFPL